MCSNDCFYVHVRRLPETRENKNNKEKQIELWHYWDIPGNQQHLEELVDQFNQSQDKIEVKVSYIPDEDFKKQLALSMSEEKMPDIALVDSSDFQFLHQMKPFADLTDEIGITGVFRKSAGTMFCGWKNLWTAVWSELYGDVL